jgi:hypothetical protein
VEGKELRGGALPPGRRKRGEAFKQPVASEIQVRRQSAVEQDEPNRGPKKWQAVQLPFQLLPLSQFNSASLLTATQQHQFKVAKDLRSCSFDAVNILLGKQIFSRDGGRGVPENPTKGGCVTSLHLPGGMQFQICNQTTGYKQIEVCNLTRVMQHPRGIFACEGQFEMDGQSVYHVAIVNCDLRFTADNYFGWLPFNGSDSASTAETVHTRRAVDKRFGFESLPRVWRLEEKRLKRQLQSDGEGEARGQKAGRI